MHQIPETIQERIRELNALVTEHPYMIPAKDLAKFLHITVDCLRFAALQGGLPFDLHWDNGSREVKVPTLKLYMWFMSNPIGGDFLLSRAHSK